MKANRLRFEAWNGERMIRDGDMILPPHLQGWHPWTCFSGARVNSSGVEIWFYETRIEGATDNHFDHPTDIPFEVLRQSTGLTDKNGLTEVFEGDVCDEGGMTWIIRWSDEWARFEGYTNGGSACGLYEFYGVVIGNIYENPELLEPAK